MIGKILKLFKSDSVAEPLVLQNDIWKKVVSDLKAIGSGEYHLPSNQIGISILAPQNEDKNLLNAAFGNGRLESFLAQKLAEEKCRQTVKVILNYIDEPNENWKNGQVFEINYDGNSASQTPTVIIKILNGTAVKKRYKLSKETINIGRSAQALDKYGTPIRKNDVVFQDIAEEPNNYVSKIHAQIQYNSAENIFYLSDSGFEYGLTTNGTRLFRQGNLIAKLNADQKVPLQNGDEIHLGKASVRFEMPSYKSK